MTKSTITREQLRALAVKKIESLKFAITQSAFTNIRRGLEDELQLAKLALAAMDSEPDRNPVLAYADSYRDMAKQGIESVQIWSVITDLERNIAPLYRHAQPAPEMKPVGYLFVSEQGAIAYSPANWGMPGFRLIGQIYGDIDVESQPAPVVPDEMPCGGAADDYHDGYQDGWNACRAAMLQAEPVTTANKLGNSPVIPDGYVMVPKEPTAEMQSAGASAIRIETTALNKLWTGNAVFRAMLAAAPHDTPALNSVQSVVTVSDTWIPVSERMPEDGQHIIIFCDGAFVLFAQCRDGDFFDIVRDGEDFFETTSRCVTHWMPMPAAPQEVKGE
ncbi:DUF551 domain-containing protein [Klebsiella aerogenes]|uniref:DUF551 domain-containing protein n=1 Tax=Klebsiella aerogenes TaxID=548 RepID=UPI003354AB6F